MSLARRYFQFARIIHKICVTVLLVSFSTKYNRQQHIQQIYSRRQNAIIHYVNYEGKNKSAKNAYKLR